MGPFLDEFFEVAQQMNPLLLSDGEIGLFTAVLMICPGIQLSFFRLETSSLM